MKTPRKTADMEVLFEIFESIISHTFLVYAEGNMVKISKKYLEYIGVSDRIFAVKW